MHIEIVEGEFDCVSFADLRDWLNIWSVENFLGEAAVHEAARRLEASLVLHLRLLLVLVQPDNAIRVGSHDV